MLAPSQLTKLMDIAGVYANSTNPFNGNVLRAWYHRPVPCGIDEAIMLAAQFEVDPVILMRMLVISGEIPAFEEEQDESIGETVG